MPVARQLLKCDRLKVEVQNKYAFLQKLRVLFLPQILLGLLFSLGCRKVKT